MTGLVFAGAGRVADFHARAIAAIPSVELVGFVEPDEQRAAQRSREWGCTQFADLDAALANKSVDAVFVLTPVDEHERTALAAIEAGRHVLIEKPVATADGVARIRDAAAASGVVAMPAHNYAYQPEFTQLRRLIGDGELGDIRAMWITYAIAHPEEIAAGYSGVLEEVMVHHSYLTLALLGMPEVVYGSRMRPAWQAHTEDDQAWMTWEFGGRTSAHLFASFAVGDDTADPWTFVVKMLGTEGGVSYSWCSAYVRRALGTLSFGVPAYEDSYTHEVRAFLGAVNGDPSSIASSIDDALAAARILEQVVAIADDGGRLDVDALR